MSYFVANFKKEKNKEKGNIVKSALKGALIGGATTAGLGLSGVALRNLINVKNKRAKGLLKTLKEGLGQTRREFTPNSRIGKINLGFLTAATAGGALLKGQNNAQDEKNKPWLIKKGVIKKPLLDQNNKLNKGVF